MADDQKPNENIEDPISNDQEVINQEEEFEDTDDLDDDDQGMETE